jgi:hypothetical protein
MTTLSKALTATLALGAFAAPAASAHPDTVASRIQLAILLDTSGSMEGLINQARTQLWSVVNDLARAERQGHKAILEVALYEYGKQTLPASEGYIRKILGFTTDLDRVSEELFALTTNGGDEFCGQVIDRAADELGWTSNPRDLKLIYIAGNEPFTQGPIDYKKAVAKAIGQGIAVNTIHCGDRQTGIQTGWQDAALLADGSYMFIDQNRVVASITAPQDAELARLSAELNETYIGFGREREEAKTRQQKQDSNAARSAPSAAADRARAKASGAYRNDTWDLVDAVKNQKVELAKVKDAELPAAMRGMNPAERTAYVGKMDHERTRIAAEIKRLSEARDKFVVTERAKHAKVEAASFDEVMSESVKTQGAKKGYTF